MEPTPRGPELLRHGVDERGDVVVGLPLDLRDAGRRRGDCTRGDLGDVLAWDCAHVRPTLERRQLDVEPARERALVRPDPGHGRAGAAGDHYGDSKIGRGR